MQWERELEHKVDIQQFEQCFKDVYRVTNVPKLRSFQYRLLQRAIITNIQLVHWGVKSTNLCSFCELQRESYTHLFVKCEYVKELWLKVEPLMDCFSKDKISFDVDAIMCNRLITTNPAHVKNLICLIVKQYIY